MAGVRLIFLCRLAWLIVSHTVNGKLIWGKNQLFKKTIQIMFGNTVHSRTIETVSEVCQHAGWEPNPHLREEPGSFSKDSGVAAG